MPIFNNYYQPFNFKLRDLSNIKNPFYQFSQKSQSMTIHHTLLVSTFNLVFFFFSSPLYKTNFYKTLYLNPFLFLFLSKKTFSKLIK